MIQVSLIDSSVSHDEIIHSMYTGVEDINDPMYCNGRTLFNNSTCKELIMNTQPIEPPTGDPSIGVEVLVLAITIPVASVLLILVIVMVIFVCLCIHCIRMSKRRQHAMYNGGFIVYLFNANTDFNGTM